MPQRLEVQRTVAASAGEIFAVLTDPRGRVAIDSSGVLIEASGDKVAKLGDTFVVQRTGKRSTTIPLGSRRAGRADALESALSPAQAGLLG